MAVLGMATSASAVVLTIYDDFATQTGAQATIECTGCLAWQFDTTFGSPDGQIFFDFGNPNAEAGFINTATGTTSFTGADATKVDTAGAASFDITSSAAYLWLKIGNNGAIIQNTGGANNLFEFDAISGTGSGLSHYTQFGTSGGGVVVPSVPLPATLPLFLTALGAGGFAFRRKQKAA